MVHVVIRILLVDLNAGNRSDGRHLKEREHCLIVFPPPPPPLVAAIISVCTL